MVNVVLEQVVKFGEFCHSSKAVDYVTREDIGAVGILFDNDEYALYISTTGKIELDVNYRAFIKGGYDENTPYVEFSPIFIGSRTIPPYIPDVQDIPEGW